LQDLVAILWFLVRFSAYVIGVGLLAWGGGAILRWLHNRDR